MRIDFRWKEIRKRKEGSGKQPTDWLEGVAWRHRQPRVRVRAPPPQKKTRNSKPTSSSRSVVSDTPSMPADWNVSKLTYLFYLLFDPKSWTRQSISFVSQHSETLIKNSVSVFNTFLRRAVHWSKLCCRQKSGSSKRWDLKRRIVTFF
jgi:hypothetical protein